MLVLAGSDPARTGQVLDRAQAMSRAPTQTVPRERTQRALTSRPHETGRRSRSVTPGHPLAVIGIRLSQRSFRWPGSVGLAGLRRVIVFQVAGARPRGLRQLKRQAATGCVTGGPRGVTFSTLGWKRLCPLSDRECPHAAEGHWECPSAVARGMHDTPRWRADVGVSWVVDVTKPPARRRLTCGFVWWAGAGSNRRPSTFQADARTN